MVIYGFQSCYQSGFFKETELGQACRLEVQVGVDVSVLSLKFIGQVCSEQIGRILYYSHEAGFLFLWETFALRP